MQPHTRPRVCIATLDPANGGGVLAMMKTIYQLQQAWGNIPELFYLSINGDEAVSAKRFLLRKQTTWPAEFRTQ